MCRNVLFMGWGKKFCRGTGCLDFFGARLSALGGTAFWIITNRYKAIINFGKKKLTKLMLLFFQS